MVAAPQLGGSRDLPEDMRGNNTLSTSQQSLLQAAINNKYMDTDLYNFSV